jgi:hypothetical protein
MTPLSFDLVLTASMAVTLFLLGRAAADILRGDDRKGPGSRRTGP